MVRQYYKWSLDELELADRLGFDGVGVNEHHQNGYGFMASPNIMAAALARRTPNNSAICVLGNTLALYSPATRVAEEFAMIDCLSDGRLIAGFPVGLPRARVPSDASPQPSNTVCRIAPR
jgi:alkanesulfonate monooxygenase SsuD/methylene tetrahydromethanopterin reductase-like flavin-dependent oxidoreductase (luciferase family)